MTRTGSIGGGSRGSCEDSPHRLHPQRQNIVAVSSPDGGGAGSGCSGLSGGSQASNYMKLWELDWLLLPPPSAPICYRLERQLPGGIRTR